MCDSHGNVATFEPIDANWGERLERATAVVMGGAAIEVGYLMTPEQARGAIIEGTVTQADRDRPRAAGRRGRSPGRSR